MPVDDHQDLESLLFHGIREVTDHLHQRFGTEGHAAAEAAVFQTIPVRLQGEQGGIEVFGQAA